MLRDLLLVAAGGAIGALLRFATTTWLPRSGFPWATLLVNLVGSFLIGYLLLGSGMEHAPRLFFAVGLLGAFTTMSAFSAETIALLQDRRAWTAGANVLANALGGPLLAFLGWWVKKG